jgi:transposase
MEGACNSLLQARLCEIEAKYKDILAEKDAYIGQLEEQVLFLKSFIFQAKSQKMKPLNRQGQLYLFDVAEMAAMQALKQAENQAGAIEELEEVAAHARRKKGRKPIPAHLERVEEVHDLPEDQKACPCGCQLSKIGEEVSEKLDIIPQQVRVIRHVRIKYACRACEGVEDDGPTVKIAPMPPQIIPQSIVSPGLLAFIMVSKFLDALPLYRQSSIFARLGIDISRATMSGWVVKTAQFCRILVDLMLEEIRKADIINLDESPVQVLNEPERANTSKSYMWVARGGPPSSPIVIFHYDPSRGGLVAQEILGDFRGYLQTDGYKGYDAVGRRSSIVHVGCLQHVRSKFVEMIKACPQHKSPTAVAIINLIAKIYGIEKAARLEMLTPEQIKDLRQEKSKPIMDEIKALLDEWVKVTPPKSSLGKAIHYALGQWKRVLVFLEDGRLSPDNNAVENLIRILAVGRKNWLFAGSPEGAKAAATIFSLIATAKANGLNPYLYLKHIFTVLPAAKSKQELLALLPQNIDPKSLNQ